jgi:hypothetical protein
MRNKGMQLGAMLVVMLLMSMAFVPAVSAQSEKAQIQKQIEKEVEKQLNDLKPDDVNVEWIIDEEDRKEYNITFLKDGNEQKLFVKQWTAEEDEKQVWKFNVFEIKPDGVIASDVSIGKDSYYWFDSSGVHMHFGPKDKELIMELGIYGTGIIAAVLIATGVYYAPLALAGAVAAVFALALAIVITVVDYVESNSDDSIDVVISWYQCLKIPIYVALPGSQNVYVKIGSGNYCVPV